MALVLTIHSSGAQVYRQTHKSEIIVKDVKKMFKNWSIHRSTTSKWIYIWNYLLLNHNQQNIQIPANFTQEFRFLEFYLFYPLVISKILYVMLSKIKRSRQLITYYPQQHSLIIIEQPLLKGLFCNSSINVNFSLKVTTTPRDVSS